ARDEKQGEKYNAADSQDQKFDISKLLGKTRRKRGLSLRLRLERRVREGCINGLGYAHSVVGTIELENVPAGCAFHAVRNSFIEILPLQPKLALIAAWFVAMIDAVQIELPGRCPVKRSLERDPVADLPSEALRKIRPCNGALPVFHKVVPLIVRHYEFGIHMTVVLYVDHELRKEILLILIDAAEPMVVRDAFHAGDRADFVTVRN